MESTGFSELPSAPKKRIEWQLRQSKNSLQQSKESGSKWPGFNSSLKGSHTVQLHFNRRYKMNS